MARRRYLSSDVSLDEEVDALAQESDFAALLYTWMIPHAEDDATITGSPNRLRAKVIPLRDKSSEDVSAALGLMEVHGLFEFWDRESDVIYFPPEAFYRYQSYIPDAKRRPPLNAEQRREATGISDERRKTPQNTASLSLSLSPSLSPSPSSAPRISETASPVDNSPRCFISADIETLRTAFTAKFPGDKRFNYLMAGITDRCPKDCNGLNRCGVEFGLRCIDRARVAGGAVKFAKENGR